MVTIHNKITLFLALIGMQTHYITTQLPKNAVLKQRRPDEAGQTRASKRVLRTNFFRQKIPTYLVVSLVVVIPVVAPVPTTPAVLAPTSSAPVAPTAPIITPATTKLLHAERFRVLLSLFCPRHSLSTQSSINV